jgi:hypothetical protein
MKAEDEMLYYLDKYGNTRECDLLDYCMQVLSQAYEKMKKTVDRMVVEEKIFRIVHNKLDPPQVYLSLKEPLPPESVRDLFETDIFEDVEEDAARILKEAAEVAEKTIEETEFHDT